jgi:hypothetical protein
MDVLYQNNNLNIYKNGKRISSSKIRGGYGILCLVGVRYNANFVLLSHGKNCFVGRKWFYFRERSLRTIMDFCGL